MESDKFQALVEELKTGKVSPEEFLDQVGEELPRTSNGETEAARAVQRINKL